MPPMQSLHRPAPNMRARSMRTVGLNHILHGDQTMKYGVDRAMFTCDPLVVANLSLLSFLHLSSGVRVGYYMNLYITEAMYSGDKSYNTPLSVNCTCNSNVFFTPYENDNANKSIFEFELLKGQNTEKYKTIQRGLRKHQETQSKETHDDRQSLVKSSSTTKDTQRENASGDLISTPEPICGSGHGAHMGLTILPCIKNTISISDSASSIDKNVPYNFLL